MTCKNVAMVTLGCDKNRVDGEKMLAIVAEKHNIVNDVNSAQVVIVNSCAFLEASRQETIDEIFRIYQLKQEKGIEKIVLSGCLPSLCGNDFFDEFIEVDGMLGVNDGAIINDVIEGIYNGERVNALNSSQIKSLTARKVSTKPYAYLKIADGCFNRCSYCLIPKIRGKYFSYDFDGLIAEAKSLGNVTELILVAQDTTCYGDDKGKNEFCRLIDELSKLDNVKNIRLLYCYPEKIDDKLIETIKNNPKVVKYVDIPLQHADDKILKLMNRRGSYQSYLALIKNLKSEIPEIAIRSTFIAGFPGETEKEFKNLLKFIKKAKMFNVGFFAYSLEEGTKAFDMDGQVEETVKQERVEKLYSVQQKISKKILNRFVGKFVSVTVDEQIDENAYVARAYFSAPEIDTVVFVTSDRKLSCGETCVAKITERKDLDLVGEIYELT